MKITKVYPTHGGLEFVIHTESEKYTVTGADFRRIGEDVLFVGNGIGEETAQDLTFSSEKLSCIQKALKHLEYSAMSERKLLMKLHGKFSKEVIESAVDIIKENGYIDDVRLAGDFCEEYFVNGLVGPAKIKAKLYQKGFSREIVSQIFEEYDFSEEQIQENIRRLIWQKFRGDVPEDARGKALEYLVRQGYSYDDAKSFLNIY